MQSDIFSEGPEFVPLVGHLFELFSCGPHGDVQIFRFVRGSPRSLPRSVCFGISLLDFSLDMTHFLEIRLHVQEHDVQTSARPYGLQ